MNRREFFTALPLIGAAAAVPMVTQAASPLGQADLFQYHFDEMALAISEAAGDCDGWNMQCGFHPRAGAWHQQQRFWVLMDGQRFPVDHSRTFDPRTGEHTDCRPVPDLTGWRRQTEGA